MTAAATFAAIRDIVDQKQAQRLRWPDESGRGLLVDAFTASRIVAVREACNADNKAKLERMVGRNRASFARVVDFALRAV